jgi:hypothetical protein
LPDTLPKDDGDTHRHRFSSALKETLALGVPEKKKKRRKEEAEEEEEEEKRRTKHTQLILINRFIILAFSSNPSIVCLNLQGTHYTGASQPAHYYCCCSSCCLLLPTHIHIS